MSPAMISSSSSSNQQSTFRNTKHNQKILRKLYVLNLTIASLLNVRDRALYPWTQVDTVAIRNPEERPSLERLNLSIGRAMFIPHLPSGILYGSFHWYWLPGTL
jgi:hypothetical protein